MKRRSVKKRYERSVGALLGIPEDRLRQFRRRVRHASPAGAGAPIEDLPRNISPCGIIGLKDSKIKNITLENIEIVFPGGGDPHYAHVGLDELDKVPEMPKAYPEFSQHMELPAWGFFVRHVDGLIMKNISLKALKNDYRTAIVLDDVSNHSISELKVEEPDGARKEAIFERK